MTTTTTMATTTTVVASTTLPTTTSTATPTTKPTETTLIPESAAATTIALAPAIVAPSDPFVLPGIDSAASVYPQLAATYNGLLAGNLAVSVSVRRDGVATFAAANGLTNGWQKVNSDTPMVVASVSKLITAATIARLANSGAIDLGAPVPWDVLGIGHDPAWNSVTVRELLDHTSGMAVARKSWLDDPGSCAIPLAAAMARPPEESRGKWHYSNGNYCALGLLVAAVTGESVDVATQRLVFAPAGVSGAHLTTSPDLLGDGPYVLGTRRLDRLGGAGHWMISTDDVAAVLQSLTETDRSVMTFPGVFRDQYGWGHTGTVDGAKACAWVMEGGRTIVAATVAGNVQSSGGAVCDALIPALAIDLGIWADRPIREPTA